MLTCLLLKPPGWIKAVRLKICVLVVLFLAAVIWLGLPNTLHLVDRSRVQRTTKHRRAWCAASFVGDHFGDEIGKRKDLLIDQQEVLTVFASRSCIDQFSLDAMHLDRHAATSMDSVF